MLKSLRADIVVFKQTDGGGHHTLIRHVAAKRMLIGPDKCGVVKSTCHMRNRHIPIVIIKQ